MQLPFRSGTLLSYPFRTYPLTYQVERTILKRDAMLIRVQATMDWSAMLRQGASAAKEGIESVIALFSKGAH